MWIVLLVPDDVSEFESPMEPLGVAALRVTMSTRTDPTAGPPPGTDSEATALAYVSMVNERDYAAIPRLVSETFVIYDPAVPAEGVHGPKGEARGREGLGRFMKPLTRAFPDFEIAVLEMLTGEGIVMYEVRLTMTHEGPLGGLPPTGRRVDVRGVSVLRLEDGLVTEHRFHTNMQDSAQQLGLTSPAVLGPLPKLLLGKVRSPR